MREPKTSQEVEAEIERLRNSEYVKLAKREWYVRNKRKQYMYQLRSLEKRGQMLADCGVTLESLEEMLNEIGTGENYENSGCV